MTNRASMIFAVMLPVALLAGCATPETRLRNGLVEAGLSEPMARCMAQPMAERLTNQQLMKLRALRSLRGRDPARLTIGEVAQHIRDLGDPEIMTVTAAAATRCTLGL